MIVSTFSMSNKDDRIRFFEKSFLFANIKPNIVFEKLFLTMSNANIDFKAWNLQWRFYTITKVFLTTKRVEWIKKKEFATTALDPDHETFIVHVTALNIGFDISDKVCFLQRAQIAYLKVDEIFIKISSKYTDFADVFSLKLAIKLSKYMGINDHNIKFVDNWQPLYGSI